MLIVFEGIDGSGKDTQISLLRAFLRQHRIACRLHKYPTRRAKAALLHLEGKKTLPPHELAGIFAQDIAGDSGRISRELSSGFAVICDRYLHSTLAYQGSGPEYARLAERLGKLNAVVPDLVVLLDVAPRIGAARKRGQKKPDRFERDVAFLSRVRRNYLRMAREGFLSYKTVVVDASRSQEGVFTEVVTQVEPLLVKKMGR